MTAATHPAADGARELPLRSRTPGVWAELVLDRPLELLDDHAHLERKAAMNALALVHRWPEGGDHADTPSGRHGAHWTRTLSAIARDEVEHLGIVLRLLTQRGGRLSRGHANPYAAALHGLVRRGAGLQELLDRLLIAALIEARSCERFQALAAASRDPDLAKLYRSLLASEHGHHRQFLDLAGELPGAADELPARWAELLDQEARLLDQQPPGPRMHSGCPPTGTSAPPRRTSPSQTPGA